MKKYTTILMILLAVLVVFGFTYYRYKQCRNNGLTQAYCLAEQ